MFEKRYPVIARVRGKVVEGAKKATELGFPTINIAYDILARLPAMGIYAGTLECARGSFPGAVCLGGETPKLEIYCFDDVPIQTGDDAEILFLKRLSDFVRGSDEDMKKKIATDVMGAMRFFAAKKEE